MFSARTAAPIALLALVLVYPVSASADETPDPFAPAFLPMPVPDLMASAASPDPETAARALSSLLAMGSTTDHALMRLLSVGTTQDERIALALAARPDAAAVGPLLTALDNHEPDTSEGRAIALALRACVPLEFAPPAPAADVDGRLTEDPRAWREWGTRHRRTTAAACLGRSSLSVFPLAVMLVTARTRRR